VADDREEIRCGVQGPDGSAPDLHVDHVIEEVPLVQVNYLADADLVVDVDPDAGPGVPEGGGQGALVQGDETCGIEDLSEGFQIPVEGDDVEVDGGVRVGPDALEQGVVQLGILQDRGDPGYQADRLLGFLNHRGSLLHERGGNLVILEGGQKQKPHAVPPGELVETVGCLGWDGVR